jgi:hypothetical protein
MPADHSRPPASSRFYRRPTILIVLIDPQPLCDAMSDDEWAVRFRSHPDYPIQCVHRPTHAYLAVSSQFWGRAAYEFASLAWIGEAQRPSIANMETALGALGSSGDQAAQDARLRAFIGEDDPWLKDWA